MRTRSSKLARHVVPMLPLVLLTTPLGAQEPVAWGSELRFSTFSVAAIDRATGESGVAVTTRVPCVGNAVPHVGAGIGAVATQASTRVEYGPELLELLGRGRAPADALAELVARDSLAARRQVGVIDRQGRVAQHTGSEASAWAGHRSGTDYVVQGNLLEGPEVIEAVARSFESTAGSGRHLADRLIEALWAGQLAGGDARKGRAQSAAVIVADPRPGRSRRPDGVTADINVCEHAEPVGEMRRIYDAISETLGFRTLQQFSGSDVAQLRVMLHAAGHYRADEQPLGRGAGFSVYDADLVRAVDSFRRAAGLSTPDVGSPPGLVDAELVERLWAALELTGRSSAVRQELLELTAVRR